MSAYVLSTLSLLATTGNPPVPASHIPPAIVGELRALENQFDLALLQDCAPERCFSKGCVYGEHVVVDKPRNASLPGLGESEGPGSVPPQEYLTQARCEFTHEKSVSARDVSAVVRRLEQKLSKGWLVVSVGHQILEPVSPSLREPPPPKPEPEPAAKAEPQPPEDLVPPPPQEWEWKVAASELWVSLLPHFSWMIALLLTTLAALTIIWGLRRVGRESLEEKALLAQLSQEPQPQAAPVEPAPVLATGPEPQEKSLAEQGDEGAFVEEQTRAWGQKISSSDLAKDDSVVIDLLREWLRTGEFALLAKAVFLFKDQLPLAFPTDGELAMRKIEFAEFLRNVDEQRLPSDAEFFRKLNHHAISSSLLAQSDADVYRSLREEFGSAGVAGLIETLSPRHGALLFALVPIDCQHEAARILSPKLRLQVAEQLLLSNRISKDETALIFDALRAARAGLPVKSSPSSQGIVDRGREFDAAGALSILLPQIHADDRSALFNAALERQNGSFPLWYEEILFPDMLLKLPAELQTDMLLDVDIRGLAGWYSMQHAGWQERFMGRLQPAMQSALRASLAFASRADQLLLARRGRSELATAIKRLVARGKISFADVVV